MQQPLTRYTRCSSLRLPAVCVTFLSVLDLLFSLPNWTALHKWFPVCILVVPPLKGEHFLFGPFFCFSAACACVYNREGNHKKRNKKLSKPELLCFPRGRLGLTRVYKRTVICSVLTFWVAELQFYSELLIPGCLCLAEAISCQAWWLDRSRLSRLSLPRRFSSLVPLMSLSPAVCGGGAPLLSDMIDRTRDAHTHKHTR